jgi:hypothetical protein
MPSVGYKDMLRGKQGQGLSACPKRWCLGVIAGEILECIPPISERAKGQSS